jgi:hypothetical protein
MNETIRGYIQRRVRWCFGIAIAGWLFFPLFGFAAQSLPPELPRDAVPIVGVLLFGGALFAMQRVQCPKCKAKVGRTIGMPLVFGFGSGPRINFCPYCGVNLDTSRPQIPDLAHSQDPIS